MNIYVQCLNFAVSCKVACYKCISVSWHFIWFFINLFACFSFFSISLINCNFFFIISESCSFRGDLATPVAIFFKASLFLRLPQMSLLSKSIWLVGEALIEGIWPVGDALSEGCMFCWKKCFAFSST